MNKTFNSILNFKIKKSVADSDVISETINHKYLQGKYKEIVLSQLVRPFLPMQYDVGTGKICDSQNFLSNEIDILICSKLLIQPMLFEFNLGLYPMESALACIEVKSTINKAEYKSTIKKFNNIRERAVFVSGFYGENDEDIKTHVSFPSFEIFAFNSNLAETSNYHIKEFERYQDLDSNWRSNPIVRSICIVNRGWWIFTRNRWQFCSGNNYSETINYISNLINTLKKIEVTRGNPRLGHYLTGNLDLHPI